MRIVRRVSRFFSMNRSFPIIFRRVSRCNLVSTTGFSSLFDAYSPRCELMERVRGVCSFSSLFRPRLLLVARSVPRSCGTREFNARVVRTVEIVAERGGSREKGVRCKVSFDQLNDFEFSRNVTFLGFPFAFFRASAADEFSKRDRREKSWPNFLTFVRL